MTLGDWEGVYRGRMKRSGLRTNKVQRRTALIMDKEAAFEYLSRSKLNSNTFKEKNWVKKSSHTPITRKWNKPIRHLINQNSVSSNKRYFKSYPKYKTYYYPTKKLCDITGLPTKYVNVKMFSIYYYNSEVYNFINTYLSEYDAEMYVKLRNGDWEKWFVDVCGVRKCRVGEVVYGYIYIYVLFRHFCFFLL